MTRTTKVEYHPDRKVIHFGSPPGDTYWRESTHNTPEKKKRKKGKKK